jgi:hypothetical protein
MEAYDAGEARIENLSLQYLAVGAIAHHVELDRDSPLAQSFDDARKIADALLPFIDSPHPE